MLGLPDHVSACLFDLDGVLTQTAKIHSAAWTRAFNEYLHRRADRTGEPYLPFDSDRDYASYVDGRPRYDGVRSFLASRNIHLPEGSPDDSPQAETVCGLGNAKNELLLRMLDDDGVEAFPGSIRYLDECGRVGLHRAVVSASKNARAVLRGAGLTDKFEVVVDGRVASEEGLSGKPSPQTFQAAADRLGVSAREAAVFEDALAGMQAGRDGGFGYVVGVDRHGQAAELMAAGASIVVEDLADLLADPPRSAGEAGRGAPR